MRTSTLSSIPQTPTPSNGSKEVLDVSRQLQKHTPLGAYPTPQSSLDLSSPFNTGSAPTSIRTSTSSLDDTYRNGQGEDDEIGAYLEAHDQLRRLYPNEEKVPHVSLCVVGGQSAGKSSFLSSLTKLDLYCAERRATSCRILISSRRGGKAFTADVQIVVLKIGTGEAEIVPFALTITDEKKMGQICHWAGEEARRSDGGYERVRSWTELEGMSNEERTAGRSNWVEFTRNVVIINVRGPGRPNFDIEDLPGLNGHAIPQKLVTDCIAQKQNIVVLCLSAGSKDASPADPEIQLAQKHDPTGERTIGVITRADFIAASMDEEGSTFVDYLLGTGDHLGDFSPQGGWWPLRLRSHKERSTGVSLQQVRQKEIELFTEDEWTKIQEKSGRKFGIEELEKKLEEMFGEKVRENIVLLKKTFRESMKSHNDWLVKNPTIQDPIGALHDDVIYQFSQSLHIKIHRSNQSGTLVDLQTKLQKDIQKAVPEFMPFTEDEGEQEAYRSFWKFQGFNVEKDDRVYVNALMEKINEFTSRRNPDEIDGRAIMQFFQSNYIKRWDVISKVYIESLWKEVEDILLEVAKEICGGYEALKLIINEKLSDLTSANRQDTLDFLIQMIHLFSAPPSDLLCSSTTHMLKLQDKCYQHFLTAINGPLPSSSPVSTPSSSSSTSSTGPRILHDTYTLEERTKCAKFQSKIGMAMMTYSIEFSSIIGKYAQARVLEYTKKVVPCLRRGMGLDEVVEPVRKRLGDVFESDKMKKRERETKIREVKKLNEIQQHLESIMEM